jgi:hypothetical protein
MAGFPAKGREPFMAHWNRILEDESVVKKTILLQGEVAGSVVSFVHAGEREVGYWTGREFWGRASPHGRWLSFCVSRRRAPSMPTSPVTTPPLSGFWRTAGSGSRPRIRKT